MTTTAEYIKKIKQAKALTEEIQEAMDRDQGRDEELGEVYHLLTQARIPLHKAHLRLKRRQRKEPLGVS